MKKLILIIMITIFILSACSMGKMVSPAYYILQYNSFSEDHELIQKEPIPNTVVVNDASIPQNYSRKQIVIRHFGPKITYAQYDLWGVKLSKKIPDFVAKRLENYKIFSQTQREMLYDNPDLEISMSVSNIEYEKNEYANNAHLAMDFYLKNVKDEKVILHYGFDKKKKLALNNVENFVVNVNDILLEETDNFIKKILEHYGKASFASKTLTKKKTGIIKRKKRFGDGIGSLLLPSISNTDNEPYYLVYDKANRQMGTTRMGNQLILPTGSYNVLYGSGTENMMMQKKDVKVYSNYETVVPIDWGCLVVDIKDEDRNFVKIPYEIFDMDTSIGYGTEFPADEELGEQQQIWVLKPGRYKVTINNSPINTYKDFTSVYVEEGKIQTLSIIVNTETEGATQNLVGAGVISQKEMNLANKNWKLSSAIHANFSINSSNETDKNNPETSMTFNTQMENRALFNKGPYHYTMKNHIEFGTSKQNEDAFKISADEFDLKNTLIYYFVKNIGLYTRLDANTHVLSERYYEDNLNYQKIDIDGDVIATGFNKDYLEVKNSIFPLILKEGIGLNWRILNRLKANINLRTGFGLRQDFNKNYYITAPGDTTMIDGVVYRNFIEQPSEYQKGTEISLIGNFRLPLKLTYSINTDILIPFDKNLSTTIEWENVFNLKLIKYLSIDYKLKLKTKNPEEGTDYITREHSLFLRISYILK